MHNSQVIPSIILIRIEFVLLRLNRSKRPPEVEIHFHTEHYEKNAEFFELRRMNQVGLVSRLEYSLISCDWAAFSDMIGCAIERSLQSRSHGERDDFLMISRSDVLRVLESAVSIGHLIELPALKERFISSLFLAFSYLLENRSETGARKLSFASFSSACATILGNYTKWKLFGGETLGTWDACRCFFRVSSCCGEAGSESVNELIGLAVSVLTKNSPQYLIQSVYFRDIFRDILMCLKSSTKQDLNESIFSELILLKMIPPFTIPSPSLIENILYIKQLLDVNKDSITSHLTDRNSANSSDSCLCLLQCVLLNKSCGVSYNTKLLEKLSKSSERLPQAIMISFLDCTRKSALYPSLLEFIEPTIASFPRGFPYIEASRQAYVENVGKLFFCFEKSYRDTLRSVLAKSFASCKSDHSKENLIESCSHAIRKGFNDDQSIAVIRSNFEKLDLVNFAQNKPEWLIDAVVKIFDNLEHPKTVINSNQVFYPKLWNLESLALDERLTHAIFAFPTDNKIVRRNQFSLLMHFSCNLDDLMGLGESYNKLIPKLIEAFPNEVNKIETVLKRLSKQNSDELLLLVAKSENLTWWNAAMQLGIIGTSLMESSSIEEVIRSKQDLFGAISFSQKLDVLRSVLDLQRSRL